MWRSAGCAARRGCGGHDGWLTQPIALLPLPWPEWLTFAAFVQGAEPRPDSLPLESVTHRPSRRGVDTDRRKASPGAAFRIVCSMVRMESFKYFDRMTSGEA